jgi:2-polyprenyl-3-methyl-5-hydroxy-6-metoxy-1,4-benzoquinol methylase
VSIRVHSWFNPPVAKQRKHDPTPPSIRAAYEAHGARDFYREHGGEYANPHAEVVHALVGDALDTWRPDTARVLDLAAGAGEATLALRARGATQIDAVDPYTADAYRRATGAACEPLSFEQIEAGALGERRWSLIVCSFALHLAESSRLPTLCWQLARHAPCLLILTPHKRPVIEAAWGWTLRGELLRDRVRARLYDAEVPSKIRAPFARP